MPQHPEILLQLEAGGINVDGFSIDADEVWNLAEYLTRNATAAARIMFPAKPAGFRRATVSLGHYAYNRATAMRLRGRGDVNTAAIYEAICEQIYRRLPEFARW